MLKFVREELPVRIYLIIFLIKKSIIIIFTGWLKMDSVFKISFNLYILYNTMKQKKIIGRYLRKYT